MLDRDVVLNLWNAMRMQFREYYSSFSIQVDASKNCHLRNKHGEVEFVKFWKIGQKGQSCIGSGKHTRSYLKLFEKESWSFLLGLVRVDRIDQLMGSQQSRVVIWDENSLLFMVSFFSDWEVERVIRCIFLICIQCFTRNPERNG